MDIKELATKGAKVRIKELEEELFGLRKFLMQEPENIKVKEQKMHWTQRPENEAKVRRIMRKAAKARYANARIQSKSKRDKRTA